MVNITVSARGRAPATAKGLPISVELSNVNATVKDVKTAIARVFPRFNPSRQKLSLKVDEGNKALDDETKLVSLGITSVGEFVVKDLGPQIGWRTVFLVEYAGPLVIHPIFYHLSTLIYRQHFEHSHLQRFMYGMVMTHFIKRELETLFVHRFSHDTMPLRNIFKNSAHYHLGSGLAIAWSVYDPSFGENKLRGTLQDNLQFLWTAVGLWILAEFGNLHAHITLRNLRPPGTKVRAIPYGFGFNWVSCPNYLWEIIGWAVIAGMTNSNAVYAFFIISAGQMLIWALKKHSAYKHEFGKEFPKDRKALFPFIV